MLRTKRRKKNQIARALKKRREDACTLQNVTVISDAPFRALRFGFAVVTALSIQQSRGGLVRRDGFTLLKKRSQPSSQERAELRAERIFRARSTTISDLTCFMQA